MHSTAAANNGGLRGLHIVDCRLHRTSTYRVNTRPAAASALLMMTATALCEAGHDSPGVGLRVKREHVEEVVRQ
jgi:hypothetical protein